MASPSSAPHLRFASLALALLAGCADAPDAPPAAPGPAEAEAVDGGRTPKSGLPAPTIEAACPYEYRWVDFERDAEGAALVAGQPLEEAYAGWGLRIEAGPREGASEPGRAIAFDTSAPTGGDRDLGTPSREFGGPGSGRRHTGNMRPLGNVLIRAENVRDEDGDGRVDSPDDHHRGARFAFVFDAPRCVDSLELLDVEADGNEVRVYGEGAEPLEVLRPEPTEDNGARTVVVGRCGVSRLEVELVGSGAVDRFAFHGSPCAACEVEARLLDFEARSDGAPLRAGESLGDAYEGVVISTIAHDHADVPPPIVFDSAAPTGGDRDLGTPSRRFGGPGRGRGGARNARPLGQLAILGENHDDADGDGLVDVPDDEARGGWMEFSFEEALCVDSLELVDLQGEPGRVSLFGADDAFLGHRTPTLAGDNGVEHLWIGQCGVRKLKVELRGSGAVDDLRLRRLRAGADDDCDGVDQDCDGAPDDDYVAPATRCGAGACAAEGVLACVDGALVDRCAPAEPTADDVCDGIDQDCDGAIDEHHVAVPTTCGVGACGAAGELRCVDGAEIDSCVPGVATADDLCDGVDQDCDGAIDEHHVAVPTTCGVGACGATGTASCVEGLVLDSCAPGIPTPDVDCDGVDQDCDGAVDEGWVPSMTSCGIGACGAVGSLACVDGAPVDGCEPGEPVEDDQCDDVDQDCDGFVDEAADCSGCVPAEETCDGADQDCDGFIDEGVTRACSTACGDGVEACVPIPEDVCNSALIVSSDEWPLTNTGLAANPDGRTFIGNVARCFAGDGGGTFLARSRNFGVTGAELVAHLASLGHTLEVDASAPWDLETLQRYDAVFLAGDPVPDDAVLVEYLRGGGHVYIAAGTGQGGARAEATRWNPFLANWGLAFEPRYAGARAIAIRSTHPLFEGVASIYQNNENPVRLLPGAPEGAQIVEPYEGESDRGYFAVFDDPTRRWAACDAPAPAPELCDGLDNDCNGLVDDGPDGGALTRACVNDCGGEGVQLCESVCDAPGEAPDAFEAVATIPMGPTPEGSGGTLSTLQAGYYDRGRDEVAVFSFGGRGRVLDRAGNVLREVTAPLSGSLDGATYDVLSGRALFTSQSCVLVEAETETLTELARHDDLAALHGLRTCAGIAVGRDGHLYVVSYGTDELVVLTRDTRDVVRRIDLGAIGYRGCDGIARVPGSGNFLLTSTRRDEVLIVTPTGAVVAGPSRNGEAPLSGGVTPQAWDGMLSICETGHVWVCEEYGTRCVDYAPVGGDRNTCGCLDAGLPADAGWSACDAPLCCDAGLTACEGACVDTTSDPSHCGGCGVACGAGEECAAGSCEPVCAPGTTRCEGTCVDTASDAAHCGACGLSCGTDEACVAGSCEPLCPAGTTLCGDLCVTTSSDPANCGGCGVSCGADEVCAAGSCEAACPAGTTLCGSLCVTIASDPVNCGACGVSCGTDEACVGGSCEPLCPTGTTLCGDVCVTTSSDPANCGGCGVSCGADEVCAAGSCEPACPAGTTPCGGACVDVDADPAHCGGCGVACGADESCVAGACELTCPTGTALCGDGCVDPQSDASHCGACGVSCGAGERCELGACVDAAACAPGLVSCSGSCVDPASDDQHCGGCGEVCGAGLECQAGACVLSACGVPGDAGLPTAVLASPAANAELGQAVPVTGTVSDVDLAAWSLELAPAGTREFVRVADGTGAVVDGELATLDPSLLENGPMTLRLSAVDCLGQVVRDERPITITGDAKVGVYRVSFQDLEVPLAGLPIRITRTYDSRRRGRAGDFGMGWTLDVGVQGRVGRNVAPGRGWSFTRDFLGINCTGASHTGDSIVEVRLSERDVYRFRPRMSGVSYFGAGACTGFVEFEQVGGRPGASLVPLGSNQVVELGADVVPEAEFGGTDQPWDPSGYQLVTREGWRYQIDRAEGVEAVWDASGRSFTVGPDGISHSSGVGVSFTRSADGLITEIVDPAGESLLYEYEGRELAAVVDRERNPATRFFYQPGHFLERIQDPTGATPVRVEYDSDGRMARLFDAAGNPELVDFDPTLRVGTFTSREGVPTRTEYDERGRLVELQVANYFPTRFAYDDENRLVRQERVEPLTGVPYATQRWEYDDAGNVTLYVDEGGVETRTSWDYDGAGRPVRKTVVVGDRAPEVTEYDAAGRITQSGAGPHRITTTYDAEGRVATRQVAGGEPAVYAYDARGNIVSITTGSRVERFTWDANSWLTSVTNADGTTVAYEYDASGRRVATRIDGELSEQLVYDAAGRVVTRIEGDQQTDFTLDEATGLASTTITVPALGGGFIQRVTTEARDLDGRLAERETREYLVDASGTVLEDRGLVGVPWSVQRDDLAGTERRTFPDGSFVERRFDGVGRLILEVDEEGREERYAYDPGGRVLEAPGVVRSYDAFGRLASEEDALGRRTAYGYDAEGRLERRERFDAAGVSLGVEVYAYAADGRLAQVTDAAGRVVRFGPNGSRALGPDGPFDSVTPGSGPVPSSRIDEAGHGDAYSWDEATRTLTRTLVGQTANERFVADEYGRIVEHVTFEGDVIRYGYDEQGRRTRIELPATAEAPARTYQLRYTAWGDLAEVEDSARGTTTYAYDGRQRLTEIAYPPSAAYPSGSYVRYGYDRSGKLTRRETPAGTSFYAYDDEGRLASVSDGRLGGASYAYTRDATGFVTRVDLPDGSAIEREPDGLGLPVVITHLDPDGATLARFEHVRDASGRIVAASETVGGVTRGSAFEIDERGRLVRETRDGVVTEYVYDDAGNRLEVVRGGVSESYAYDAVGRLVAAGDRSFTWDAGGALVSTSAPGEAPRELGWDALDRLVAFRQGSLAASYDYDHAGVLYAQSESTGTGDLVRELLVDPTGAYEEVLEESSGRAYVLGEDRIAVVEGGAAGFLRGDGRDVRMASAFGATSAADTRFDAFGRELAGAPRATPYGFQGEAHDDASELVYMRARWYDPAVGRFVSRDTLSGEPPYAFADGDPLTRLDPSGHFTTTSKTVATVGFSHLAGMSAPAAIPGTLQMVMTLHVAASSPLLVPASVGAVGVVFNVYLLAYAVNERFIPKATNPQATPEELLEEALEKIGAYALRNNRRVPASTTAVYTTLPQCEGAFAGDPQPPSDWPDQVYVGTNRSNKLPGLRHARRAPLIGNLSPGLSNDDLPPPAQLCLQAYTELTGIGTSTLPLREFGCSERDALDRLYEACGGENGGMAGLCGVSALRTVGNACDIARPDDGAAKANCCACCFFWANLMWNIQNGDASNPYSALRDCGSLLGVIREQLAQPHCVGVDRWINGPSGVGPQ